MSAPLAGHPATPLISGYPTALRLTLSPEHKITFVEFADTGDATEQAAAMVASVNRELSRGAMIWQLCHRAHDWRALLHALSDAELAAEMAADAAVIVPETEAADVE